jgi:hypothetical protein
MELVNLIDPSVLHGQGARTSRRHMHDRVVNVIKEKATSVYMPKYKGDIPMYSSAGRHRVRTDIFYRM